MRERFQLRLQRKITKATVVGKALELPPDGCTEATRISCERRIDVGRAVAEQQFRDTMLQGFKAVKADNLGPFNVIVDDIKVGIALQEEMIAHISHVIAVGRTVCFLRSGRRRQHEKQQQDKDILHFSCSNSGEVHSLPRFRGAGRLTLPEKSMASRSELCTLSDARPLSKIIRL